jgi:hypothetical protein
MIGALLTPEHLRRILLYDPHTGLWKWKEGGRIRDWFAGYRGGSGGKYLSIRVGGSVHYAHRLAFLYMTGKWPEQEVDHIDGDPTNTRWNNLRQATHLQNMQNTKMRNDNRSGVRGVCYSMREGKWKVQVASRHVGYFTDKEEAISAYEAKARDVFGEYRRLQ